MTLLSKFLKLFRLFASINAVISIELDIGNYIIEENKNSQEF